MTLYYVNAPVTEHPSVGRARLRHKLVAAIDRMIMALDWLDGDSDLEPSLSFAMAANQDMAIRTEPLGLEWVDLEDECEGEGEACEDEGAEHDGREPDQDDVSSPETGEGPQ
ncbi:hypothetical protein BZG35_03575 [Brevundimonas sp. LM2]|uniref:hypothetical protein n=1 Tax=Brevundimonas sp. LM2 TaxID=1938605 RepID=UPI000983FFC2|nr:hypothetical protein [Brevundimonas sp. LM2]AQR60836.1 hypothetical protein BZG35_03575 [Brevundimonas sp. LM2]